ncbi:hypothetical protein Skr01_63520 [Sphaerisporangium krabiense]|nr:zinc ribbon domain-containing protein [Sphaerisporangium krabiense]GII66267.1 hypothetical protein Skr01_63520 [Sphaerisporangium krabiense]
MATYQFLCPECGPFEVALPMGTASTRHTCPECRCAARRVFCAPHLGRLDPAVAEAFAREERSRDAPEVVSGVPPGRRPF